jgi:hypothetical protein
LIASKYCQTTSTVSTQVLPDPVAALMQYLLKGIGLTSSAMFWGSARLVTFEGVAEQRAMLSPDRDVG